MNDQIPPEIRAQVLRDAAAQVRRNEMPSLDDPEERHCKWCLDHDGDCDGLEADDIGDSLADALDTMAVEQEGRAAYLAEQARNQAVPIKVAVAS